MNFKNPIVVGHFILSVKLIIIGPFFRLGGILNIEPLQGSERQNLFAEITRIKRALKNSFVQKTQLHQCKLVGQKFLSDEFVGGATLKRSKTARNDFSVIKDQLGQFIYRPP